MEKAAAKVYRRRGTTASSHPLAQFLTDGCFPVMFAENSLHKSKSAESTAKKEPRPRSRSLYTTNSSYSDDVCSIRDLKPYEGSQWMPRGYVNKTYSIDEYSVSNSWDNMADDLTPKNLETFQFSQKSFLLTNFPLCFGLDI